MFDLIHANTVRRRLRELRKFIDFWYGPHKRAYEMKEPDSRLPLPLRLFYRHNANRPNLRSDSELFYDGDGGHHLFPPKHLEFDQKKRVKFFMEYQGDWDGYTLNSEDDPPVWLCGYLPIDDSFEKTETGERQLNQTLSEFLVTHVLLSSIYDCDNSATMCYGMHHQSLVDRFRRARTRKQLVWDAENLREPYCPHYPGKVYLYSDSILVHEDSHGDFVFSSNSGRNRKLFKE